MRRKHGRKKEVFYSSDIEIALATDAVDRIEEH